DQIAASRTRLIESPGPRLQARNKPGCRGCFQQVTSIELRTRITVTHGVRPLLRRFVASLGSKSNDMVIQSTSADMQIIGREHEARSLADTFDKGYWRMRQQVGRGHFSNDLACQFSALPRSTSPDRRRSPTSRRSGLATFFDCGRGIVESIK